MKNIRRIQAKSKVSKDEITSFENISNYYDVQNWEYIKFKNPKTGHNLTIKPKNKKQEQLINEILGKKVILAMGSAGTGKAQPLDAKILTPFGWKLMGDIKVGDLVISQDGKPTKVNGVFPQGEKEIFSIIFSDNSRTECCEEHLWAVKTSNDRSKPNRYKNFRVKNLKDIMQNIRVHKKQSLNYSIPIVDAIEFESRNLVIDPYLMGILLGDGCLRYNVTFSSADKQIVNRIETEIKKFGYKIRIGKGKFDHYIVKPTRKKHNGSRNNIFIEEIKRLGLLGKMSNDKFVPEIYKFNSIENRLEILRGLIDSDGTCDKKGNTSFSTSSRLLANDVKFLVNSLGGTTKETTKQRGYKKDGVYKKCMDGIQISISMPPHINPFFLDRKASRVVPKTKYKPTRFIKEIICVGKKQAQCISVENPNHLYVTDDFIVTHNSFLSIAVILKLIELGKIEKLIISKPPIESGPNIGFMPGTLAEKLNAYSSSFMNILNEIIGPEQRDLLIKEKIIEIENIGFMRGLTIGNTKGVCFICDEAQNVDFAQHKLILSRLGSHPESRIIYCGDQRQSDLKYNKDTLSLIYSIIKDSPYVGSVIFEKSDIVRSEVVKDLLNRIEDYEDNIDTNNKKGSK